MEYRTVGKTGIFVSNLCFGTMSFGGNADAETSKSMFKYCRDTGINFFDTADVYSGGHAEEILGECIAECRNEIVLTSKVFYPTGEGVNDKGLSRRHIINAVENSLRRLKTDRIEFYFVHAFDDNTPMEETLLALDLLQKQGKILYPAVSNWAAWQIAKANGIAKLNGWEEFSSIQGHYNLIFREEEREMAGYCKEENIAMTPYSALASGRLSRLGNEKTKRMQEDSFAHGKYDATAEQDEVIIKRVAELAEKRGVTMTEVSLAWLLTKVTAPVVGATKLHHIDGAVKAVDLTLTDEELSYLEEPYVPHALVGVMAQNK